MRAILLLSSLLLLASACTEPKTGKEPTKGTMIAVKDGPRDEGEHKVTCGCRLEVGECGEYIFVDEMYIPLEGFTLDSTEFDPKVYHPTMPFCGKGELEAKAKGEVKDGKYVASSFVLFKPVK